jgi:hypothetical protein
MTEARKVRFDHLIGVYAVGSGDWSWRDEYEKLIDRPVTQQLIESIRSEGIREPVLLGNDGRVWDGHHRIVVAMHLGLDTVPVEFSGGVVAEEPEWEYGGRHVAVSGWPRVQEHGSREDAEKDYATCGMNCGVARRRDGGPWVPVKQEGAETDGTTDHA